MITLLLLVTNYRKYNDQEEAPSGDSSSIGLSIVVIGVIVSSSCSASTVVSNAITAAGDSILSNVVVSDVVGMVLMIFVGFCWCFIGIIGFYLLDKTKKVKKEERKV